MPSRPVVLAIVIFWLATTGWLVYREFSERYGRGEPPPYTIDLTDEVGDNSVRWTVLQKDKAVGDGFTRIQRLPDRTFRFGAEFRISHFKIFILEIPRLKVVGTYRVTEDGRLLEAAANLQTEQPLAVEFDFSGAVRNGLMHPELKLLVAGVEHSLPAIEPTPVSDSGRILNPMHLVHKITGLREGHTWKIPLMDPLKALPAATTDLLPAKDMLISHVEADVKRETLAWHGTDTDCFKIEYRRPEGKVIAGTWVRRSDAAVLQQWASYEGIEYTLVRAPEH